MKFALIVPALNEELAIAGTLRRCLAAREVVTASTAVDHMYIVFVNDGSTDGTQAIVDQEEFKDVVKVRFEKNKGYGAAIKEGFKATDADLVGFIDGDGTCDPNFCVNLVNDLIEKDADVAIAARLQPDSEMPFVRKLGNTIFAKLLGFMAGKRLTDTASGFRVIKRSSLKLMTPLPDRLHYTPAMSAICMLDPRLKIVECHGMKYKEREGRSKLSVLKDGFRFLFTILFTAFCYSPVKTLTGFSLIAAAGFAILGAFSPMPWFMINIVGAIFISVMLGAGVVVHQLNYLLIGPRRGVGPFERLLQYVVNHRRLLTWGGVVAMLGLLSLPFPGLYRWLGSFGAWLSIMLCVWGAMMLMGGIIVRIIWAVGEKQYALVKDEYAFDSDADHATKSSENPESNTGVRSPALS